jgi:hypothetical protein
MTKNEPYSIQYTAEHGLRNALPVPAQAIASRASMRFDFYHSMPDSKLPGHWFSSRV